MNRILVIYGTTEGHTRKIANSIGDTLRLDDFDVDVVQAGAIDPRPADYDGVVVAASVHGGRYQHDVGDWVRAHGGELAAKPTAFVSVCLAVLQNDPTVLSELDAIVRRFTATAGWRPSEIKLVAGALPYTKYNWFKRWIMKRITAKAGGDTDTSRDYDYTDWADLRVFAGEFGRRVAAVRPRSHARA
jgi:menaquinone-dependent protoporphyrinogen oxidase